MRPIRLEIEGLQSFAEKQVIDFKTLTEHGLFGIFGKTGSGKSTILDAITLAIYGDVVRLENSVDDKLIDLLNTNSDKIEIKFVFILGEQEYTIYRKFPKMKKKLEFGSKKVLMYCGDEIIAEKNSEIKSKVEELIGLSMGDFTRSVVLPQGKFSEFLKLTGTDKRDMLERIFGLEKYGKKLTAKLRYEKSIKQKEIEAIKNQIQGKGDLDPKKIEELKEKLKELLQKRDEFDLKNTEFNKKYKDKEEVKDLLEEFEKHNEKKLKLEGNIKNIEELKINIENNIAAQNIIVLNKNKKTVVEKIKVDEKTKIDLLENLEKLKIEVKKVTIELEDLKKKEEVILKKSIELEVDPNKREVLNKVITIKKDIEKVVKKLKGTTNIQE
ncbi:MAG: AAA family ATPase, partial [Psychrilyobacter sp.]|nr:AAA family ATPase [Psychrilyobacter sp.]